VNRRRFLASAATVIAASNTRIWSAPRGRVTHVLRGALVFDGTGAPPREADVSIEDGRIAAVGSRLDAANVPATNLRGLALAPGFIDIHGHTDLGLLVNPQAESKVRQGVTTEVTGQDGSSIGPWTDERHEEVQEGVRQRLGVDLPFRDIPGFFDWIDEHGAALNVASMVGQGTIRGYVVGPDDREATDEEVRRMVDEVRAALSAGACGLSSGLEYTPGAFAGTDEITELAAVLAGTGLPYATHLRNEDDRVLAALEEALHIGGMASVAVEISHLKAQGGRNWWKAAPLLELIDHANGSGLDVGFDIYPYIAYSTGLASLFPVGARDGGTDAFVERLQNDDARTALEAPVRAKIDQLGGWGNVQISGTASEALSWAHGRRLGALAAERGEDPYALLVHLLVEDRGRSNMVGFGMSEENVESQLAHPLSVICSDGGARATYGPLAEDVPHPRTFGAFPRVLGHYVREREIMPLEAAIHKMTALPARRLGLTDRGIIRPGAWADLVAFDPSAVTDRATFENPHQYPAGIPHVWVNGVQVLSGGEQTGALPGRSVRPGG
jgi:N-acyl-D-amino-acid deacylase